MAERFQMIQRTLMGPGPSDVSQRVLEAMAQPTIGHLDPLFVTMMDEVKELLKFVFKTKNKLTFPVSAPGSAGMETCFVNLVEPGDKVIVCQNGVFGGRMKENVERAGGVAVMIQDEWGTPVSCDKVEDAFKQNPDAKILAFVHAETSTGVRSDAETLVKIAHKNGALAIVDAVTSLAGCELEVDKWNIDAIYSGTQKCLSCPPGISPVSFNDRAIQKIKGRILRFMEYWEGGGGRSYHHTAPVNSLYALRESLIIVKEMGLENSWKKHAEHHEILKAGLEKLGFKFLVEPKYRLPQLNSIYIPEKLLKKEAECRKIILEKFNLEIGAGLGALAGKVWRIGLMGESCSQKNIDLLLQALNFILQQ